MPLVKVLQGYFRVICEDYSGTVSKRFERRFYGETIGEALDNLVKVPEVLKDEINEWIFIYKDHDYHFLDDRWKLNVLVPILDDEKTTTIPLHNIKDLQTFSNSLRNFCIEKILEEKKSKLSTRNILKFEDLVEYHISRQEGSVQQSESERKPVILGSTLDTIIAEWDQTHKQSFFLKLLKK